jgi:hypothetical protein
MSEANIATARRLIDEAFNNGNLEVLDEIYADDFVDHDPLLGIRTRRACGSRSRHTAGRSPTFTSRSRM